MKNLSNFIVRLEWWQWIVMWISALAVFSATGIASGYSSGIQERQRNLEFASVVDLQLQYELGMTDLNAGNYDLARQRFEYILRQNPSFPGITDRLAEVLIYLSKTADPGVEVEIPQATPSPTPDTRAIDEIYAVAQRQLLAQDWKNLRQTILALRDIDPLYQVSQVDRMLYLALRNAGIQKILEDGDLEGGLYDLSLAEKFVPLDSQATTYREWAYIYKFGVSFWGIFPDKVVNYFSQLAAAAPFLRDFSGIFAKDRYQMALLLYGDRLAEQGDWCAAAEQYTLAQSLLDDQGVQPTVIYAGEQCHGTQTPTPQDLQVTPTPELTSTLEATVTMEATITLEATPMPEITLEAESPTPTLEPTPTPTQETP
ncbi:MAG: hypothetical protein H8D34_30285 [Chloroflexi bacterium]|nr:hypothetical protein [Chloroflexota bacterium]